MASYFDEPAKRARLAEDQVTIGKRYAKAVREGVQAVKQVQQLASALPTQPKAFYGSWGAFSAMPVTSMPRQLYQPAAAPRAILRAPDVFGRIP